MKQPARTPKAKYKTREQLNQEGRERKRIKKRRGNVPGSRTNVPARRVTDNKEQRIVDPRIGSKKPVPLCAENRSSPTLKQNVTQQQMPVMGAQEQLSQLENDPRLDALLEKLEASQSLTDDEQKWLDKTLNKIDALMTQLGISVDEEESEPQEEEKENIFRLLKDSH